MSAFQESAQDCDVRLFSVYDCFPQFRFDVLYYYVTSMRIAYLSLIDVFNFLLKLQLYLFKLFASL